MAESNGRPHAFGLMDFSDRELLNVVLDCEGGDGWIKTEQIVAAVGLEGPSAMRCVGIRFSWMKRYGVMERHEKKGEWRLTEIGRNIALGSLNDMQKKAIDGLSEREVMEATRLLTGRFNRVGPVASTMMRRAWQSGTGRR